MLLKLHWFRKGSRVPGEVTLPVCVLDVQPDDIIRDFVEIKSSIHGLHVRLVVVVPAGLVVPQGKQWRKSLVP